MVTGWKDGRLLDTADMTLPVRDLGVLRGFGVFDYMRTYGGIPFHLKDHLERLMRSAGLIGLEVRFSAEDLEAAVLALMEASGLSDAGIRIVCTGGESPDGITPAGEGSVMILAESLHLFPREWYENGVGISTFCHTRYQPEAKTLNYIPAVAAQREAHASGGAEALYREADGRILEGTTSNIFLYSRGAWRTPGREVLEGITRRVVLNLLGERCVCGDLTMEDLREAEEVFLTSSNKEVLPVVRVDSQVFGSVPGPETRKVMAAFREYTASPDLWNRSVREAVCGSV